MLKVAKKYLVAFRPEQEARLIEEIEKAACFEIEQIATPEHCQESQQTDFLLAEADFALNFLKPYGKKKKSFNMI